MERPLVGRTEELDQLRALLRGDGVPVAVVRGESGVGKTALVDVLATEAEKSGITVQRIYGSPAARRIPFGAAGHLLDPESLTDDPTEILVRVRQTLTGDAGARTLVVVDDAHEIDDATAAVVQQASLHGEASVVLVLRDPPGPPPSLVELTTSALLITIERLSADDTTRLVGTLLACAAEEDLARLVWNRTLGLPMFVTILVKAAEAAGTLERRGDRVSIVGTLPTATMHELARSRMRVLDPDARSALEVVALVGEASGSLLDAVAGRGAGSRAMDAGFLRAAASDHMRVAHPVYGEAVLEVLSTRDRRALAGKVADASPPPSTATERIRLAILMLDAGRSLAPDAASQAAREALARLDHRLAERLARAALESDAGSIAARLTLTKALGVQGRGAEAESVAAAARPETPQETAEVAIARGHALAFLLGRAEEAINLLATTAAELPEHLTPQLDADRALYGAMRGNFREAIDAGERVLANDSAPDLARLRASTNVALARVLLGRLDGLEPILATASDLALRHAASQPLARIQAELTTVSFHHLAGRIATAHEVIDSQMSGDRRIHPVWHEWRGLLLDSAGRLGEAAVSQRRAIADFSEVDPFRLRPQAIGFLGIHHGQMADIPADLLSLLAEAEEHAADEPRLTVWIGRARAWLDAANGSLVAAAECSLATGERAIEGDHVTWGAMALHDAVRFGHASRVRHVLEAAVAYTEGAHLIEAMADHATAVDESSVDQLEAVARRFARFGTTALAVEAWCQAASLAGSHGDQIRAQRAATRAALLRRQVPMLRSPAVATAPPGLTTRELDVATAAAAGEPSRDIAATRFLSVRTVDNHLHSAYRKLGLAGRDELREALGLDDPEAI